MPSVVAQTGGGSGSILVTTETSGSDLDPDGYTVLVDGHELGAVQPTGQVTIPDIAAGSHVVLLSGIATNCQINGTNRRGVTVSDGQSSPIDYSITCSALPPETGSIRIKTSTSGDEQDSDGYSFAVDGGSPQPIGIEDAVTVNNVASGPHTVMLSGVAENCSLQDGSSRDVTVTSGAQWRRVSLSSCTLPREASKLRSQQPEKIPTWMAIQSHLMVPISPVNDGNSATIPACASAGVLRGLSHRTSRQL